MMIVARVFHFDHCSLQRLHGNGGQNAHPTRDGFDVFVAR
jgi:hypothetical protein